MAVVCHSKSIRELEFNAIGIHDPHKVLSFVQPLQQMKSLKKLKLDWLCNVNQSVLDSLMQLTSLASVDFHIHIRDNAWDGISAL